VCHQLLSGGQIFSESFAMVCFFYANPAKVQISICTGSGQLFVMKCVGIVPALTGAAV